MKNAISRITYSLCLLFITLSLTAQDIIVTTDARKIEAKILEVSKSEIKYKEFDNIDGPTFILETAEISSITFSNGKVRLYNQPSEPAAQPLSGAPDNSSENNSSSTEEEPQIELYVGLQGKERQALIEYLEGYPKNLVAVKGDYSMLFDKKARVYLDLEMDSAQSVRYWYEEMSCKVEGSFKEYLQTQTYSLDKDAIIKSACDMYNQKMMSKKCKLFPISQLDTATVGLKDYILTLHILRIDAGIGVLSVMSAGQTNTGGAILYGNLELKQAATGAWCTTLLVDRFKGAGSAYEDVRIQRAVEEIIATKLFFIKEYKLYSKE